MHDIWTKTVQMIWEYGIFNILIPINYLLKARHNLIQLPHYSLIHLFILLIPFLPWIIHLICLFHVLYIKAIE